MTTATQLRQSYQNYGAAPPDDARKKKKAEALNRVGALAAKPGDAAVKPARDALFRAFGKPRKL